jgi:predicted phage terminase large subunit-like protein
MPNSLPITERAKIALELKKRQTQNKPKLSFRGYIAKVNPRYQFYWHVDVTIQRLQDVVDGKIKRLIIVEPPRHGKSELLSRLFPAYVQYLKEHTHVGINSYSANLAYGFSRTARDNYTSFGGQLNGSASVHWKTKTGGQVWAAGVGGPITGKGFHIGIIDDPTKNAKEAKSTVIREGHKEWYRSTFYTRAEPDAAIVLCMTRWHTDDIVGWQLQEEKDEAENWHILHFEAIKTETNYNYPKTCTVEPDPRQVGEPLCPERYPLSRLLKIKRKVGEYYWNALFQGNPFDADGMIVNRDWIRLYRPEDMPQIIEEWIQSWDLAFKDSNTSSYVVGQVWARSGPNKYLIDQVRRQVGFNDTLKAILTMRANYPQASEILIEDRANGPAIMDTLKSKISGVIPIEPDGSKESRFMAVAPQFESGNVYIPQLAEWKDEYISELVKFPVSEHNDQVDATSQALRRLGANEFNLEDLEGIQNFY